MENNFRKYSSIKVPFYNLMFLFEYFQEEELPRFLLICHSRISLDFFQENIKIGDLTIIKFRLRSILRNLSINT